MREIVDDPLGFAVIAEEKILAHQRTTCPRLLNRLISRRSAEILHDNRNRTHFELETLISFGTMTARSVWPSMSNLDPGKIEPIAAPQSLFWNASGWWRTMASLGTMRAGCDRSVQSSQVTFAPMSRA